jgi:hypothetical protein
MTPRHTIPAGALLALALLAGCKQDAAPSSTTATGMQAMIEDAAEGSADPADNGDAPLQPGQSVQGVIQADLGKGAQRFRSLSTKVAEDIAEQVDAKLGTKKGNQAIADANRKLAKLGTGMKVDAGDVRDMVGSMAGKTFHDAAVRQLDIIHALQVNLKGKAGQGEQLELNLRFDDKTLALAGADMTYRPKSAGTFDFYESDAVQATIERFERNADGTYAIAGTFSAKDLAASPMAKKLEEKALASASGRFDYDALPLKQMPKFGQ